MNSTTSSAYPHEPPYLLGVLGCMEGIAVLKLAVTFKSPWRLWEATGGHRKLRDTAGPFEFFPCMVPLGELCLVRRWCLNTGMGTLLSCALLLELILDTVTGGHRKPREASGRDHKPPQVLPVQVWGTASIGFGCPCPPCLPCLL